MTITMAMPARSAEPPDHDYSAFPDELLQRTSYWLREFSLAWNSEAPIKLHTGDYEGAAPAFHPDFEHYLDRPCKRRNCFNLHCGHDQEDPTADPRRRTTRAFRKLRQDAPREFDALYLVCRYGLTVPEVAEQLTKRAVRLNKPERYGNAAVLMLIISGLDKVIRWW